MMPLTWTLKEIDPVQPTQAVSGNLGIVKILGYVRSDKFKIAPHKQKSIVKKIIGRKMGKPLWNKVHVWLKWIIF